MSSLTVASRFVLASVFLLSGMAKLPQRSQFETALQRYELLPHRIVRPIARALPVAEVSCALMLFVGFLILPVTICVACLLTVFSVAVGVNLVRGRRIECGCFTPGLPSKIGWATVIRNAVLIAMAIVVAAEQPRALAIDEVAVGAHAGVSASHALALAIVATVAVVSLAVAGEGVKIWRLTRVPALLGRPRP